MGGQEGHLKGPLGGSRAPTGRQPQGGSEWGRCRHWVPQLSVRPARGPGAPRSAGCDGAERARAPLAPRVLPAPPQPPVGVLEIDPVGSRNLLLVRGWSSCCHVLRNETLRLSWACASTSALQATPSSSWAAPAGAGSAVVLSDVTAVRGRPSEGSTWASSPQGPTWAVQPGVAPGPPSGGCL